MHNPTIKQKTDKLTRNNKQKALCFGIEKKLYKKIVKSNLLHIKKYWDGLIKRNIS